MELLSRGQSRYSLRDLSVLPKRVVVRVALDGTLSGVVRNESLFRLCRRENGSSQGCQPKLPFIKS